MRREAIWPGEEQPVREEPEPIGFGRPPVAIALHRCGIELADWRRGEVLRRQVVRNEEDASEGGGELRLLRPGRGREVRGPD
eukprot:3773633-Pleurochrysis_carterae.AAC.2